MTTISHVARVQIKSRSSVNQPYNLSMGWINNVSLQHQNIPGLRYQNCIRTGARVKHAPQGARVQLEQFRTY